MNARRFVDRLQPYNRRALIDLCAGKVDLERNAEALGFASLGDALDSLDGKARGAISAERATGVLRTINRLVDGCGVEGMAKPDAAQRSVLYVNTGDSYTTTVLWCGLRQRLYVVAFADWLDLRERWQPSMVRDLRAA